MSPSDILEQFIIIKLRDRFPVGRSGFVDVDDVFGIPSVGGCAFQKWIFYGRFGFQFGDEDGDVVFAFGFVMEVEVVACLDVEFVGFVRVLGFEFWMIAISLSRFLMVLAPFGNSFGSKCFL